MSISHMNNQGYAILVAWIHVLPFKNDKGVAHLHIVDSDVRQYHKHTRIAAGMKLFLTFSDSYISLLTGYFKSIVP